MVDAYQYVTLMAALPQHRRLFTEKQPPLSRLRLEQRLSFLSDEHRLLLAGIEQLVQWDYLSHEQSDAEVVGMAGQFIESLPEHSLQQLLASRLEIRSLVAALRRRKRGMSAPARGELWGYTPWASTVVRNWHDPLFGLQRPFPWLKQAVELLQQGDSLGLERLLLELNWRELDRNSEGHYFDFVAVVIYVLKWDITARWTQYDGQIAEARFDALLQQGLRYAPDYL